MGIWGEGTELLDSILDDLKRHIDLKDRLGKVKIVAGADVSYKDNVACACACVLDFNSLRIIEKRICREKVNFPYLPGYLSFREAPIILKSISKLESKPDCFIFDGNGILHPHNLGLATFLGIILKVPTIGCAKNLLLGRYIEPKKERGSFTYIRDKGRVLGAALRTKTGIKELYVSCGWGVSLKKAVDVVLAVSRYRIPEPLRLAHTYSKF
jgi:deoxyribonuclease V